MKKKKSNKWMDVSAFSLYIAVFLFLFYMLFQAGVSIYEKRSTLKMTEVTVFDYKEIEDETSPTKKTRVFERTLSNVDNQEEVFAFYVSHSYVKVYLDDDLVYELKNTNKNNSVLEVILNSDKINLNFYLNIDNNASDKKVNANGKINVTYDTYKVNLTLDSNLEYGENIVNIKEINDAKDYNSLTENDTNGYSTKIMNKLSKFKLYNSILSLVSNFMQ